MQKSAFRLVKFNDWEDFDGDSTEAVLLLGHDGQFGQLGCCDADAFKALGHDAVRGGEKTDKKVHRRDERPAILGGSLVSVAQQTNDVIGKELTVQDKDGIGVAGLLVKQLLELSQQSGQVGAGACPNRVRRGPARRAVP